MSVENHPSPERLRSFALGKLDDTELIHALETHLDECPDCRDAVENTPADAFVEMVRNSSVAIHSVSPTANDSPTESQRNQPLRLIAGYEILEEVGRGGMGVVFRARQLGLNRIVALKRLKAGALASREELSRFRKESAALATLQHPNIVQVFDAGEQDGEPFLAMEFVQGEPLGALLRHGTLHLRVAANLVRVLAQAVEAAHRQGIVHRDLKPANILIPEPVTPSEQRVSAGMAASIESRRLEQAKIVDFGLARLSSSPDLQTATQLCLGTPSYMAPEQASETTPISNCQTDVYGLGAILYECLVGRPPHCGASHLEILRKVRDSEPISPRRLQPDIPRDLETICLKCLEKDSRRRYDSAGELAMDLLRFGNHEPIEARPIHFAERLVRWVRRKPTLAALACTLILTALGLVFGVLLHVGQLQAEIDRTKAMAEVAKLERQRADENYAAARETVSRIYEMVDHAWESDVPEVRTLSEQLLEKAIAFFQTVIDRGDGQPQTRLDLATAREWYGMLLLRNGNSLKARDEYRRASNVLDELLQDDAKNQDYRLRAASNAIIRGAAFREEPVDLHDAITHTRKGLAALERLAAKHPRDLVKHDVLAWAHRSLALVFAAGEQTREATAQVRSAIQVRDQLIAWQLDELRYQIDIGWDHRLLATLVQVDDPQVASVEYERAKIAFEGVLAREANHVQALHELASTYLCWYRLAPTTDDQVRAEEIRKSGLKVATKLLELDPANNTFQQLRDGFAEQDNE